MNQCTICYHKSAARIEAALTTKRAVLSVAKEFGVSYDALRRHIGNQHRALGKAAASPLPVVAPVAAQSKPTPHAVWEFSADEEAAWAAATADFAVIASRATGIPEADILAHEDSVPTHADECAACDATDNATYEALHAALASFHEAITPNYKPGRWVEA